MSNPAVHTIAFFPHRDYGTLTCPYCGAVDVRRVVPDQISCGMPECRKARGAATRKLLYDKKKARRLAGIQS